jgi:hypothetical protein
MKNIDVVQIKRVLLTGLTIAIFFSAHFDTSLALRVWKVLNATGLDISMTPVTSDMATFSESSAYQAIYTRTLKLILKDRKGQEKEYAFNQLRWHQEKLPFLLMLELFELKSLHDLQRKALCWSFGQRLPGLSSFRPEVEPRYPTDSLRGYNHDFSCDEGTH